MRGINAQQRQELRWPDALAEDAKRHRDEGGIELQLGFYVARAVTAPIDAGAQRVRLDEREVPRDGHGVGLTPAHPLKPLIANPIGIGGGPMATDAKAARIDDTSSLNRYAVTARVAMVLKSHVGAPAGLLLEDGTQVHVVPRLSGALASIKPGMELRVEGLGTPTQRDATMWALSITKGDFVYLDVERGEGAWEIGVNGPFTK